MSLLLWINIFIVIGPLLLSFDKRVQFYKQWKTVIPAVILVGLFFAFWGGYFTRIGVWGFNPDYLSGITYFRMPLEEILFFFTASFAFSFIYIEVKSYLSKFRPIHFSYYFSLFFTLICLATSIIYRDNIYTFTAFGIAGLINWIIYFGYTPKWYPYFIISFFVAIIPFFFLEGLLLGVVTGNPLSWYNPEEIIGFRILSIPVEEFFLIFSINFSVIIAHEFLKKKRLPRN